MTSPTVDAVRKALDKVAQAHTKARDAVTEAAAKVAESK